MTTETAVNDMLRLLAQALTLLNDRANLDIANFDKAIDLLDQCIEKLA